MLDRAKSSSRVRVFGFKPVPQILRYTNTVRARHDAHQPTEHSAVRSNGEQNNLAMFAHAWHDVDAAAQGLARATDSIHQMRLPQTDPRAGKAEGTPGTIPIKKRALCHRSRKIATAKVIGTERLSSTWHCGNVENPNKARIDIHLAPFVQGHHAPDIHPPARRCVLHGLPFAVSHAASRCNTRGL